MAMLHIVDGTSTAARLGEAGLDGEVLAWADILVEGPVTGGLRRPEDWRRRAGELQRCLRIAPELYLDRIERCHKRLGMLAAGDEVVLWFGDDLFCQVHLIYLLAGFDERGPAGTRLSLAGQDEPPSARSGVAFAARFARRVAVSPGRLALARRAWDAYGAAEPGAWADLRDADLTAWPGLHGAVTQHLERLPSISTGLSVLEEEVLRLLLEREWPFVELFPLVSASPRLEGTGMGDVQLAARLVDLAAGAEPLVTIEGRGAVQGDDEHADAAGWRVRATPLARAACAGEADAVAERGIDRWLGGVHLRSTGPIWRWDAAAQCVVA